MIFTDQNYKDAEIKPDRRRANRQPRVYNRPRHRRRGSSRDWRFDELTSEEIDLYRQQMGQETKIENIFIKGHDTLTPVLL
jgi:hypothetical protein